MKELSPKAQSLWAKKSKEGNLLWLPLVLHMADSAAVAQKLWNRWLSDGVKEAIAAGAIENENMERLFVFLAAVHDLGKATPVFQSKKSLNYELDKWIMERLLDTGLPIKPLSYFPRASKTPHALATQILLEHAGFDRSLTVILGSHHGKPPDNITLLNSGVSTFAENFHLGKEGKDAWNAVQHELIDYALRLAGFSSKEEIPRPNMAAQVLLSGLVIMADWIASNEECFPYIDLEAVSLPDTNSRASFAWDWLSLPHPWSVDNTWMHTDLYEERFNFEANTVQSVVQEIAAGIHEPGILVLEAPMGCGKTEAALVAAEIFAAKAKRKGVFFALPTQATSDGIFPRMLKWVKNLESDELHSMRLMHGKSEFNEVYQNLAGGTNIGEDEESSVFVHEWFEGRKKAMLDDFVVGTIDQLLLAALKQKHVMLRHLGLANKVVIIDECHAYDAYMSQYLNMALSWLGAYQVPVIVLSATLPAKKRQEVINAYLSYCSVPTVQSDPLGRGRNGMPQLPELPASHEYPLITFTDGNKVKQTAVQINDNLREVHLDLLPKDGLVDKLEDLLSNGGCAGVIVNTVKRAQELAKILRSHFGDETVRLLHSRFIAPDRIEKEKKLMEELGKPGKGRQRPFRCIVIGTQVLEQSLDIDFDVLISDICPMDLLLQRIGRLHRHQRNRPEKLRTAFCLIMGAESDSFETETEAIYGKYLLMRTKARLPQRIDLPKDISPLVQDVYSDETDFMPISPDYQKAISVHKRYIADKEERAKKFRIGRPWPEGDLRGWLDTDVSEESGEAAVRDGDQSIEVLVVRKNKDGNLCFLPWIEDGRVILKSETPDGELARTLARCSIRLPPILCTPWMIDNTIKELEDINRKEVSEWQDSPWLRGELFLILDEKYSINLCGYHLVYDQNLGLLCEKEDSIDAGKGI